MAAGRPLAEPPAFDGMDLAPALTALWGRVPDDAILCKLKGDASTRSYYRVQAASAEPGSLVVMRLPDDGSAQAGELPFVNVQRHLRALGVDVPRILVDDTPRGVLLLEDLGDVTFEARLHASPPADWPGLYGHALELLAALHARATPERAGCIAYSRRFDQKLLRWELEHFRLWGLEALDLVLTDAERALLDRSFDRLVAEILALPQGFAHRDYQSRNLMWATPERLVVIDFQDALGGPVVYDLVALLCDSYVELDEPLQRALIARMAALRGEPPELLEHAFWRVAAQRKLKDAGRFVFIDQVRGNADFLPWFSRSLRYAGRALSHLPDFAPLADLLTRRIPGFPDRVPTPPARTGSQPGRAP